MSKDEKTSDNASCSVDAQLLGEALQRLSKTGRAAAGNAAAIELRPDGVTLEWAGAHESLTGEGTGHGCVSVPDKVIVGLSHIVGTGTVTLVIAGDRIRVGRIGFSCQRLDRMPPQLLAADANQLDVLLLGYRESPDRIAEAGLTDEVARMGERLKTSAERAAQQLEWLGVSQSTIEAWVVAHLQEIAEHSE